MALIFYGNFPTNMRPSSSRRRRLADAEPDKESPKPDTPPLTGMPDYDSLPQKIIDCAGQGIKKADVFRQGSSIMIDFSVKGDIELDRNSVLIDELVFTDLVGSYHSSTIGTLEQVIQEKVARFTNTKAQISKKTVFGFEYIFCSEETGIDRINLSCSQDSNRFFDIALSAPGNLFRIGEDSFKNMAGYIINAMVSSRP